MTFMATLLHTSPSLKGHEIYNFARLFLGYHYYTLIDIEDIQKHDTFTIYGL